MNFKTLKQLFTVGAVLTSASIFAQDTGGVNQAENPGTVIKGKAPVAKDLLKVRFPKPKYFKLKNGLSVYVLEDHRAPVVRFNLQIRAGSIYEAKPGVASTVASMLTEGTTTQNFTQIAGDMEDMGANLNANAGLDMASLTGSSLSESTDKLLALMSDVLLHPSFPADRMDRLRGAQRGGGGGRGNNPTAILGELTNEVFYGGTKYARLPATRQELAAIKPDDLTAFYSQFYKPDGAVLGVTGDVNTGELKAKLETAFAGWNHEGTAVDLPAADFQPKKEAHIFLIDRPGSAQSVLQFGNLAVRQTDPDYIPLVVANRILGGGSSGRLFQNIRERKGYTYGAYSSLSGSRWPGIWGANASVRTEVTEPAVGEFFKEFLRLQTEIVPLDELNSAKRSIVGGFALALQSPEGILSRTLDVVQNNLPSGYWDEYPAKINAVTQADVARVAQKYLGHNNVQLLVVGERKLIEPGLAKYGTVQIVDPTKISSVTAK